MAEFIIGVHDGHNASAAIICDGELLFAVQEERFLQKKNYYGFPARSIRACMEHVGIEPGHVLELAFSTRRRTPQRYRSHDQLGAFKSGARIRGLARRVASYPIYWGHANMGWDERVRCAEALGFRRDQCARYDHHVGHASTAYFGMREDHETPYLVITMDGKGDLEAATVSIGHRGRLNKIGSTPFTDSLGAIYGLTTGAMGFVPLEHEYKLMGMAPYAKQQYAKQVAKLFKELIEVDRDALRLRRRTLEPTFLYHRRLKRLVSGLRFDNVCGGLQLLLEDSVRDFVCAAIAKTGIRRVLCAGGVFMNVKANKLLAELPELEYLGVPPSCGDESMCYGVAWHAYAQHFGSEAAATIAPLRQIYYGPDVEEKDAEEVVRRSGFAVSRHENIEAETTQLLARGHIVARCKGRMEFGARALGNRSILADPQNPDVVRIINSMIKKRDFWMPFAPVVRFERMHDYFVVPKNLPNPYMMLSYDTTTKVDELLAAVHSADLTARAQTVKEEENPEYYGIISGFEQITGRGVLLNTSFNLHGFPIVLGAKEAMTVFANSGLRYLALGQYLVSDNGR